jgi:addiction module HigA family antidote
MVPIGLSINRLARDLRVAPTRIHSLIHLRRAMTADTALRLARYFNGTAAFWMHLQTSYDLDVAARASETAIARDVQPRQLNGPS